MKTTSMLLAFVGLLAFVPASSAGEISSVYTSLDLEKKCRLVASNSSEGSSAEFACRGYKGMAVRVAEGDLRTFVSFGPNAKNQVAATQTLGPFNTVHHTLEWRLEKRGGKWAPFATILRYFWDSGDGNKGETLVVTKLDGDEACQIAHIRADGNPNANIEARHAADNETRGFNCTTSEIQRHMP